MKFYKPLEWWALPTFLAGYLVTMVLIGFPPAGAPDAGQVAFLVTMTLNIALMALEFGLHLVRAHLADKRHVRTIYAALVAFVIGGNAWWFMPH